MIFLPTALIHSYYRENQTVHQHAMKCLLHVREPPLGFSVFNLFCPFIIPSRLDLEEAYSITVSVYVPNQLRKEVKINGQVEVFEEKQGRKNLCKNFF